MRQRKPIIRISESTLLPVPIETIFPHLLVAEGQRRWNTCYFGVPTAMIRPPRALPAYEELRQSPALTSGSCLRIFRIPYLGRVQQKCSVVAHCGMTIFTQTLYIEPRGLSTLLRRFIEARGRQRMRQSTAALKRLLVLPVTAPWPATSSYATDQAA